MGSSPPCRRSPATDQLEITPANEQKVLVGTLEKRGPYVFRPRLGAWLGIFATVLGRSPPDLHAWIVMDEVPAFVAFERPIYMQGPVWRIQLTSPRWLESPDRGSPPSGSTPAQSSLLPLNV